MGKATKHTSFDHDDETIVRALRDQFASNDGLNLLNDDVAGYVSISPLFADAIDRHRAGRFYAEVHVDALSVAAADECVRRLLHVNPYLEIAASDTQALVDIYRSSYAIASRGLPIVEVIRDHHFPALHEWVRTLYPPTLRDSLRHATTIGALTYSQYPADLQSRILRLDPDTIKEPVLDLGCGADCHLVRALRDLGYDARGIDRDAPKSSFTEAGSWIDREYEPAAYGLIVSHLAFSTHYLYHVSMRSEYTFRYEETYVRVLAALAPGGSFRYVPSLPDLERELASDRFRITRWAASGDVTATAVMRIAP